jgi:hypothetical protein
MAPLCGASAGGLVDEPDPWRPKTISNGLLAVEAAQGSGAGLVGHDSGGGLYFDLPERAVVLAVDDPSQITLRLTYQASTGGRGHSLLGES